VERVLALSGQKRIAAITTLLREWTDGRIKLLLTTIGLRLRRDRSDVFLSGSYVPLETEITVEAGAVAFARAGRDQAVLFIAPRLTAGLPGADRALPVGGSAWKTSRVMLPPALADRTFTHEITGTEIRPVRAGSQAWIFLGEVFETVPVGILRTA